MKGERVSESLEENGGELKKKTIINRKLRTWRGKLVKKKYSLLLLFPKLMLKIHHMSCPQGAWRKRRRGHTMINYFQFRVYQTHSFGFWL